MKLKELVDKSLASGTSQRDLAARIGVSHGTINNIVAGHIPNKLTILERFSSFYKTAIEDLRPRTMLPKPSASSALSEGKELPRHKLIPLLTSVQAGTFTERNVPPYAGTADEYVETDMRGERIFALRVIGDSMEPLFHAGEVVIVNPDLQCDSGNYVVAKTPDHGAEEATIKQLKKYGEHLYLHPLNPKYDDILVTKKHKIVGKIVRKQMDF